MIFSTSLKNFPIMSLGLTLSDYLVVFFGVIIIFILELGDVIGVRITEMIENKGVVPAFLMIFAAIMVFIIFGVYRGDYIASEFIYKQF